MAQQSNCALVEFREGCRTHVQTFPRRGLHIHGVCGTHDGCCSNVASSKACLPAPLSASCVHKQPSYLRALHLNHARTCSPHRMERSSWTRVSWPTPMTRPIQGGGSDIPARAWSWTLMLICILVAPLACVYPGADLALKGLRQRRCPRNGCPAYECNSH